MENRKPETPRNEETEKLALMALGLILVVAGGHYLWQTRQRFTPDIRGVEHILAWSVLIFLVGGLILNGWHYLFRVRWIRETRSVDIILSRDDTTEPFEITKFFDAVGGMLLPRFVWQGWLQGYPYMSWTQGVDQGTKFIRLSAPGPILERITGRLQAAYQNIRFEPVPVPASWAVPPRYGLQLRLTRPWFYPLQTLKDYQALLSESFFAAIPDSGQAGLQVVLVPLSLRQQHQMRKRQHAWEKSRMQRTLSNPADPGLGIVAGKELQAALESRGKALFRADVRVWADSRDTRQAIIGTLAEASGENRLAPGGTWSAMMLRVGRSVWWQWVRQGVPSLGLGPQITVSSFHLATVCQLPSMRLRVSGFRRSPTRRVPTPAGLPQDPASAFLAAEGGGLIGITDDQRYANGLFLGMQGSGKTTAMRHYAAPCLGDPDQASIIVTPDRGDAQQYLAYIPPDKPLYILDLARPGAWGLNILADDTVPADQMAGNLLASFRTAYGDTAVMWQSAEFLQQPLYALRKVREVSPLWRQALPQLDFRHIQALLVQESFRDAVRAALPEGSQESFYWNEQFPLLLQSRGEYHRTVRPILNKLTELLSSERIRTMLCHPQPLTIRRIIQERGVLLLYTAKNEVGEETANLFANLLMSLVFQGINAQAERAEADRVPVNLFLDEVQGYANPALRTLLQESRKYGARTAAATLSLSSLPEEIREAFVQLFGHKVIFRTNEQAEAEYWAKSFALRFTNLFSILDEAQDRIQIGPDDLNSLPRYQAVAKFQVEGSVQPAFMAQTRPTDPRAHPDWQAAHPWPVPQSIPLDPIPEMAAATAEASSDLASPVSPASRSQKPSPGRKTPQAGCSPAKRKPPPQRPPEEDTGDFDLPGPAGEKDTAKKRHLPQQRRQAEEAEID